MGKAKKAVNDAAKSVKKSVTGNSVVGQITNTAVGATTGGAITANKKGLLQGGNVLEGNTGGMASSQDLTLDKTKALVMDNISPQVKGPSAPGVPEAPAAEEVKDPYLEEELENAKKRGRASTILAGANDTGGASAKRTLLGV
jgi:hypothetical protein